MNRVANKRLRIGETLTADTTLLNAHGDAGTTFAYQWNVGGVAVDGATNSTYKIQGSNAGKIITVTVTATGNYEGSVTSDSVTVPYKVIVTAYNSGGDSVTANEVYQNAGTAVAIEYALVGTHIENKLTLSAGSNTITTITIPISTPVTSSYNYIVTAAHADTGGEIYSATVTLEATGNATFDGSFTPTVIPTGGTVDNINRTKPLTRWNRI